MWNRLLDRIAPLQGEDVSALDRRDGVGTTPSPSEPRTTSPVRSHRR